MENIASGPEGEKRQMEYISRPFLMKQQ